jgi:6-pyruvoyltetrahydropterin/6-carboxytetrahydropterin synthase
MVTFRSTKTFTHAQGLSCAFRQWRADSHCRLIHGYAIQVRIEFEGELDERNWVVDFGSLKPLKALLEETFDHRLLVAKDDPQIDELTYLEQLGLANVVVLEKGVGCERFAEYVFEMASEWLTSIGLSARVRVAQVEISEHGGNSAIVKA